MTAPTNRAARLMRTLIRPRGFRNRVLNYLVSRYLKQKIWLDWQDLIVINPKNIFLGDNFAAGRGLWLHTIGDASRITIGANASLSDWVHVAAISEVTIGLNVLVGSKVIITDHAHGRGYRIAPEEMVEPPLQRVLHSKGPVTIGDNVWIGDGVAVLAASTIGDGAIIGANSVVTGHVPPNTVWAGAPARQVWPKLAVETPA